jgi:hypothetical protein
MMIDSPLYEYVRSRASCTSLAAAQAGHFMDIRAQSAELYVVKIRDTRSIVPKLTLICSELHGTIQP